MQETQLLAALRWRYAVKRFDPERMLTGETWRALEAALVLTPSAYGLQPWRFVVVRDPAVRAKLLMASWGQQQVVDASHLVVLAARRDIGTADVTRFVARTAAVRAQPVEDLVAFHDMIHGDVVAGPKSRQAADWAGRQTYIALGTLLAAAAMLKVDACPMEGIEPEAYDEILGLGAAGYRTLVACALGYRSADDRYADLPKVRYEAPDVITYV